MDQATEDQIFGLIFCGGPVILFIVCVFVFMLLMSSARGIFSWMGNLFVRDPDDYPTEIIHKDCHVKPNDNITDVALDLFQSRSSQRKMKQDRERRRHKPVNYRDGFDTEKGKYGDSRDEYPPNSWY